LGDIGLITERLGVNTLFLEPAPDTIHKEPINLLLISPVQALLNRDLKNFPDSIPHLRRELTARQGSIPADHPDHLLGGHCSDSPPFAPLGRLMDALPDRLLFHLGKDRPRDVALKILRGWLRRIEG
jgi:hypothetical protein